MDESALAKPNKDEMHRIYMQRRIMFFGIVAIVVILIVAAITLNNPKKEPEAIIVNDTPTLPEPIFEKPLEIKPEDEESGEVEEPEEECIPAPLDYMGCLELNEKDDIFDAYGMRVNDDNVEDILKKVQKKCIHEEVPDRQCIVHTVFTESENSWACEWDCLKDMASCPSYKTHLAVTILRQYVPATDVFVGRTKDYDFFMIYKNNDGEWIQPQYIPVKKPVAEVLYNDVYHSGPIDDLVFPEITQVEPGDSFCFSFRSNQSCECNVDVETFSVGDCPQLPADMRGICDQPLKEVYIVPGTNKLCFDVDEDADDALYTYKFELNDGEDHWFAGSALITTKQYNCCVNVSFEGFLEVDN